MDPATLETLALMGFLAPKPAEEDVVATAYCPDEHCTGPSSPERGGHGLTASGRKPRAGHTIAVDPDFIPLGDLVDVLGLGLRRADDTGGAIKGNKIDIFMDSHEEAKKFGRQKLKIRRRP